MIANEFVPRTTNEGLQLMQHIEDGIVVHEWLVDDEEHTKWYLNRKNREVISGIDV